VNRGCFHFLVVVVAITCASQCWALFMPAEDEPVERLLKTAETFLEKDPKSAGAHYTVGRIHYLAFSRGTRTVPAYSRLALQHRDVRTLVPSEYLTQHWVDTKRWEQAEELTRRELGGAEGLTTQQAVARRAVMQRHVEKLRAEGWRPAPEIDETARANHAVAALAAFRAAIRLQPDGLYMLGLASLMEQIADWKVAVTAGALSPELRAVDHAQAREFYLKAFRSGFEKESQQKWQGIEGLIGLVSHEAGVGYLRLSDRARAAGRLDDDAERREVEAGVKKMNSLPRGPVTPIIFALQPVNGIGELMAPDVSVDFDLRGYGPAERWTWIKPTTALLVWDPGASGEIVSGRQLFGGYTFQIFRATGYDALAALDDDGDGILRGGELAGIRAWFDRDGDGRSRRTEVIDLETLGIVGITVRATGADGVHPSNPAGLTLRDGRTLPTWDWIVEPSRN
jgi:hypothetical protein